VDGQDMDSFGAARRGCPGGPGTSPVSPSELGREVLIFLKWFSWIFERVKGRTCGRTIPIFFVQQGIWKPKYLNKGDDVPCAVGLA